MNAKTPAATAGPARRPRIGSTASLSGATDVPKSAPRGKETIFDGKSADLKSLAIKRVA